MSRVNVYLPDDLADEARAAGLNVSAVTQQAIRGELAARSTDQWLDTIRREPGPPTVPHDDALSALDAARADPPTRHA